MSNRPAIYRPQTPLTTGVHWTTYVMDGFVAIVCAIALFSAGYALRWHQDEATIKRQGETIHALYQATALPESTPGPLTGY